MIVNLLITRPEHDIITHYASKWSQNIIKVAGKKGLNVIDLSRDRVVRKSVENILSNKNPKLVFFNGHGDDNTVAGHNNEILIKSDENEHILKSKIVHSLTCSSAAVLGEKAVENGAIAYIGYGNDFLFLRDKFKSTIPLKDEIAKPFFESANEIPMSLVEGKTVKESVFRSQKRYEFWITYYRLNGYLLEAPFMLEKLMWDKLNQKVHGSLEANFQD